MPTGRAHIRDSRGVQDTEPGFFSVVVLADGWQPSILYSYNGHREKSGFLFLTQKGQTVTYKLVNICVPNGASVQIEIVHLDELLRRGARDAQGTVLYWEGENSHEAAAAMRKVKTDGEKVRDFLKPHI